MWTVETLAGEVVPLPQDEVRQPLRRLCLCNWFWFGLWMAELPPTVLVFEDIEEKIQKLRTNGLLALWHLKFARTITLRLCACKLGSRLGELDQNQVKQMSVSGMHLAQLSCTGGLWVPVLVGYYGFVIPFERH